MYLKMLTLEKGPFTRFKTEKTYKMIHNGKVLFHPLIYSQFPPLPPKLFLVSCMSFWSFFMQQQIYVVISFHPFTENKPHLTFCAWLFNFTQYLSDLYVGAQRAAFGLFNFLFFGQMLSSAPVETFITIFNSGFLAMHLNRFVDIERPLHPRNQSCLIGVHALYVCLCAPFASISSGRFASMLVRDTGL